MRGRRQELSALVLALGLHAAVLGVMRSVGDPSLEPRPHAPSRREDSFEVELGEVPGRADSPRVEPPRDGVRQARSASTDQTAHVSAPTTARHVPPVSETELGGVEPETAAVARDSPDLAPPAKPIDLGLGPDGWQRWMTAPARAEASEAPPLPARKNRYQVFRAAPVSSTGGLQEGLEASDRALGLVGPEGRVLSALQKAAHAWVAPETGVARFEVTVHRTGAVEVTLGAASAQREQWQQVAGHLASDLRSAPPRVAPPREGFKYVVEVVAEQTLPNGTKLKSLKRPHLDAPLKFQRTEASVEQANRENPTIVNPTPDDIALKLDTPGVYVAQSGKVCDYRAGVGSIAPGSRLGVAAGPVLQGACDPSQLGAKPQRVVRTRVVAQSLF
jgi:hypothetical protein